MLIQLIEATEDPHWDGIQQYIQKKKKRHLFSCFLLDLLSDVLLRKSWLALQARDLGCVLCRTLREVFGNGGKAGQKGPKQN